MYGRKLFDIAIEWAGGCVRLVSRSAEQMPRRSEAGTSMRSGIRGKRLGSVIASIVLLIPAATAWADWNFSGAPGTANAFIQTNNTTLELHCDRMRFAPAGYEDSEDIAREQGLSIRFMKNGATESGAFQVGGENADVQIVDNYPVEIVFRARADYEFVLDQIASNAALNLARVDQDISYGIFDLQGSAAAIKSLRAACAEEPAAATSPEVPEGVVYCGGGAVERQIEYTILDNPADQWNARVTVNGQTLRAMTAFSYFGKSAPPRGFVVALLGEDRSEFLVFRNGSEDWLEFGDYTYRKCN